jgi:hypothetical protein
MERLKNAYYGALAAATVYAGGVVDALAQTSTGDPSAPLDILKQARQKAASANLNVDSIASGGSKAGLAIMAIAAVGGIGLAGVSGFHLYRATQDENSRESVGRSIGGVVIGSGITILGVVIGVVTNFMTGTQ